MLYCDRRLRLTGRRLGHERRGRGAQTLNQTAQLLEGADQDVLSQVHIHSTALVSICGCICKCVGK